MLQAFAVANRLTANRYKAMEDLLVQVAVKQAYYAPGHGVLYEMSSDWKPLPLKAGGQEDWVTSEAIGITCLALQSRNEKTAW